jgi:GNAT superfamily N-acetyltransferase
VIRRAGPEDGAAMAHVHRATRAEAGYSDVDWSEDEAAWVWEQDGAIIAYAGVGGDVLTALYVLPGYQCQRIGTGLMDFAVEHGGQVARVPEGRARRFFEREGWVTQDGDVYRVARFG